MPSPRADRTAHRWPWIVAIAGSVLGTVAVWASWSGRCLDAVAPGASVCESGPVVGWPGALLVTSVALGLTVVAIVRLVAGPWSEVLDTDPLRQDTP